MLHETLDVLGARLRSYVPDVSPEIDPSRRRPAVVICPGGGYAFCSEREAEPVALRLTGLGFNAFVLNYAVAPDARFPLALQQLASAVAHVRENAQRYHTDPDKIVVMGFSAGGHLACSLGVLWNRPWLSAALKLPAPAFQPNGMILGYPVITSGIQTHGDSIKNLLGPKKDDPEMRALVSLENQVTCETAPAFLWHTFDDEAVPVTNSLLLAQALSAQGVNAELHVFPHGAHGLSLADATVYADPRMANACPECRAWIDLAARWLRAL